MDNYLQQGIVAAKAGDRRLAFDLLTQASEIPETSELAWLWLSSVVGDDSERLFCLDSVLRINPGNTAAQRGAAMLRQKGNIPAMPVYPEPQRAAPMQDFTPKQTSTSKQSQVNSAIHMHSVTTMTSQPQQQFSYETDWKKQEISGYFQYAAMELASNKSHRAVENLLIGRGASPEAAKTIVKDAKYAVKKVHREKYKKRMTRGFLVIVGGIVLTCGTYMIAFNFGGSYFLFYGAIIYGLIDFVIGLIGWLVNG